MAVLLLIQAIVPDACMGRELLAVLLYLGPARVTEGGDKGVSISGYLAWP